MWLEVRVAAAATLLAATALTNSTAAPAPERTWTEAGAVVPEPIMPFSETARAPMARVGPPSSPINCSTLRSGKLVATSVLPSRSSAAGPAPSPSTVASANWWPPATGPAPVPVSPAAGRIEGSVPIGNRPANSLPVTVRSPRSMATSVRGVPDASKKWSSVTVARLSNSTTSRSPVCTSTRVSFWIAPKSMCRPGSAATTTAPPSDGLVRRTVRSADGADGSCAS